jgi:cell division protein FtsQ
VIRRKAKTKAKPRKRKKHGADVRIARRRRVMAFKAACMLSVVGVAGYALYAHIRDNEYFLIKTIRIVGADLIEEEEIARVSGVNSKDNILLLNVSEVADRVTAMPMVQTCKVVRIFPDTVVIEVKERHPVATLRADGGLFEVDAEGVAVRKVKPYEPSPEPFITNVPHVGNLAEGMAIESPAFHEAVKVWNAFKKTAMSEDVTVSELAAYASNSVWMTCDELPYTIRWGRSDYERQALLLDRLWKEERGDLGCAEYLELRFDTDLACR